MIEIVGRASNFTHVTILLLAKIKVTIINSLRARIYLAVILKTVLFTASTFLHQVYYKLFQLSGTLQELFGPRDSDNRCCTVESVWLPSFICFCPYSHSLQRHADPLLLNVKGETPLDLAAQYGHIDTVHLLISHCPEMLYLQRVQFSPLHLAARNGHTVVALSLINAGISVNTVVRIITLYIRTLLFANRMLPTMF